ncbi:MAG TPA: hypothetical protein VMV81_13975 [Phycisphaerae bacterium]|nr:hypothetical protein [Phycisphaerae bacterium]
MKFRWLRLTISAVVITVAGAWSLVQFGSHEVARLTQRTSELEKEKQELHEHIQRLGASRRVAQVSIIDQLPVEKGQTLTRVRWQEVRSDGALPSAQTAEIIGKQLYVEGLVVKFEPEAVAKGDAEKGQSIVLFRRVFGDQQNPQFGYLLSQSDDPTQGKSAEGAHDAIWKRFWQLLDDPALARKYGIRVAQCEAPSVPIQRGQIWEISLDALGGLNFKKIGEFKPSTNEQPGS